MNQVHQFTNSCIFSALIMLSNGFSNIHQLEIIDASVTDANILRQQIAETLNNATTLMTSPRAINDYGIDNYYIAIVYIVHRHNKCAVVQFNDRAMADWASGLLSWEKIDIALASKSLVRVPEPNYLYL